MPLKVATIVGTRPEIIKLACTIKACDENFEHVLIHTGQNYDYELNRIFFEEMGIRDPDYFLEAVGKDLGETMGLILAKSYQVLKEVQPDAVLVLGDTNSALATIAAKRLKIPIFHMEAGNRCFDDNVSEEVNRRIVDHISDINLTYTENARRYLLAEGLAKDRIFVSGSPMREVLNKYKEQIEISTILSKLELDSQKYFIVSAHREENLDIEKNFEELIDTINAVAEKYQMPIIYSTHPRTWKKIESSKVKLHKLVQNHKPFGFFDYVKLQQNAFCVLSDSGTITEEATMLNFAAVNMRNAHERPEGIDMGGVIMGGTNKEQMLDAIDMVVKQNADVNNKILISDCYKEDHVSQKVVRTIVGYTNFVNRVVWRK